MTMNWKCRLNIYRGIMTKETEWKITGPVDRPRSSQFPAFCFNGNITLKHVMWICVQTYAYFHWTKCPCVTRESNGFTDPASAKHRGWLTGTAPSARLPLGRGSEDVRRQPPSANKRFSRRWGHGGPPGPMGGLSVGHSPHHHYCSRYFGQLVGDSLRLKKQKTQETR